MKEKILLERDELDILIYEIHHHASQTKVYFIIKNRFPKSLECFSFLTHSRDDEHSSLSSNYESEVSSPLAGPAQSPIAPLNFL